MEAEEDDMPPILGLTEVASMDASTGASTEQTTEQTTDMYVTLCQYLLDKPRLTLGLTHESVIPRCG